MKKTLLFSCIFILLVSINGYCQKLADRYFDDPFITDSSSTLIIPTRYNEMFSSENKISFWGDYYANLIFYNFIDDTYHKIFAEDTFIKAFHSSNSYGYRAAPSDKFSNITAKWVLFLVKNKDTNGNGRIDENDPTFLYASSPDGKQLKQLTDETQNVLSWDFFTKQGFVLVKIQYDSVKDGSFRNNDKDVVYKKVSLDDLSVGRGIEF